MVRAINNDKDNKKISNFIQTNISLSPKNINLASFFQPQQLRLEPAQAARQHPSAGLPLRRGPVEERLVGSQLADRPDPSSPRHRRGSVLVGLRPLRGSVPRRRQAHPRADRRGAQTRRQVRREDATRDVESGTGTGPQGRRHSQSGGDRGRTQHRSEYGCAQELSSSRREVHDAHAQVQHAMVRMDFYFVRYMCAIANLIIQKQELAYTLCIPFPSPPGHCISLPISPSAS